MKCSICIPTYNADGLIHRAIESCLNQTYTDFEIIISDNYSTDKTEEVVKSYKDERIKYFKGENIGIMPNFLRAYSLASGEFIITLCSDDWLEPNYLQETVGLLTDNIGAVLTSLKGINLPNMDINNFITYQSGKYSVDYLKKVLFVTSWSNLALCLMRRKDLLNSIPLIEKTYNDKYFGEFYKQAQTTDWLVLLKVISNYEYIYFTDKTSYIKTEHQNNRGHYFGWSKNTILKQYHMIRRCLDYIYSEEFKNKWSYMRIRIAIEGINNVILNLAPPNNFLELFEGYTFSQTFLVLLFPFYLLIRIWRKL